MTDILDLPDWTLLAKRAVGDEYELEAEYRLLPGSPRHQRLHRGAERRGEGHQPTRARLHLRGVACPRPVRKGSDNREARTPVQVRIVPRAVPEVEARIRASRAADAGRQDQRPHAGLPSLQPSIPHNVSCSPVSPFYTLIRSAQYEGEKIVVPRAHYAAGRYTVQRAIITRDAIRALLEGKT